MKIIISCLSPSSFFQQPNRKKIWQRKTNDWGAPTTENKGKYFSLISKPCLCRQTLTVVYSNKPIPPLLYHWIRNAEVQSKYVDYSWLWNIVPGSPALWKPLWAPFFWVCVCCALWQWHPRHSNISQGAFPARVCSAKMLEWTPTRHLGRAGDSTPGLSLGAPWSAEGLSHP